MTVEATTTPVLLLGLEGQLFAIESQLRTLRQIQAGNPAEQWQQFAMRTFPHLQSLAGSATRGADGTAWNDWVNSAGRAWMRSAEALGSVPSVSTACQPLIDTLETYASALRETIHRLSASQQTRSET